MRRRVHEVARFTKKPREVAEFYARLLDRGAPQPGGDSFNFEIEGVKLFIHSADDGPTPDGWPDDVDHIAFEVDDLDSDCARLIELGYSLTGPAMFPWGRAAYLRDPDGRLVEIHGPGMTYE
ncbi:MAG TPA: VOC family protein [Actinomycetota bacterium]